MLPNRSSSKSNNCVIRKPERIKKNIDAQVTVMQKLEKKFKDRTTLRNLHHSILNMQMMHNNQEDTDSSNTLKGGNVIQYKSIRET